MYGLNYSVASTIEFQRDFCNISLFSQVVAAQPCGANIYTAINITLRSLFLSLFLLLQTFRILFSALYFYYFFFFLI